MQLKSIAAVLVGGLFLSPASFAQPGPDIAYATPAPAPSVLVVLQPDNSLPESALPALGRAAAAARAGGTVQIVGGAATADVVKNELVREGVPASAIVVTRDRRPALPRLDPLDDTASRAVTLRF